MPSPKSDLQRLSATRIIDRFGEKKVPRGALFHGQKNFLWFLCKIFSSTSTANRQILVHCIHMEYSNVDSYFCEFLYLLKSNLDL